MPLYCKNIFFEVVNKSYWSMFYMKIQYQSFNVIFLFNVLEVQNLYKKVQNLYKKVQNMSLGWYLFKRCTYVPYLPLMGMHYYLKVAY